MFSSSTLANIGNVCASSQVEDEHELLLKKIQIIIPELEFKLVLSRGGWHRTGGIIKQSSGHIADNVNDWFETCCDSDINKLIADYADADYLISRFIGKTHYFVAQNGEAADDFVQLEIEELQEVLSHPMMNGDSLPEDIEDVIEPVESGLVEPDPIGSAKYVFRRITSIADFISHKKTTDKAAEHERGSITRFIHDWEKSSAREAGPFCHYWVLALQEYTDAWGEPVIKARPVSTYTGELYSMQFTGIKSGSELANLIQAIDRKIGYPMAWYFYMLSNRAIPHELASLVYDDQMGAYDYLPAKDLEILKEWRFNPYAV